VTFEFDAELWLWDARQADTWTFASLPVEVADEVLDLSGPRRGFGAVRVEVTIGGSLWRTSIFPDSKLRTYVLPVKKAVRKAEGVGDGDVVHVRLEILDAAANGAAHG
jgi:hypothetical protein